MKRFFLTQWHKMRYIHYVNKWARMAVAGATTEQTVKVFELGWKHLEAWRALDEKGFKKHVSEQCIRAFGRDLTKDES